MPAMNDLTYRRAKPADARAILSLVNGYSGKGLMLPRSFSQVVERVRDFTVAEGEGRVVGVVALHVVGEDMAEIRSLAVEEALTGRGVGRSLVEACTTDAAGLGLSRVFTLTYQTGFFEKLGFRKVEKTTLPQKIWGDCVHCAKFSDCDEVAMIKDIE
jgi:amino-acid N-acetyltransferase